MKSTVEQLSPTRVRINVEVPFAELEPDFQRAYKELAKQVRLPGFRPGKRRPNYSKPASAGRPCWIKSSTMRCPAGTDRRWPSRMSNRSAGPTSR